jgi:phage-related protein
MGGRFEIAQRTAGIESTQRQHAEEDAKTERLQWQGRTYSVIVRAYR